MFLAALTVSVSIFGKEKHNELLFKEALFAAYRNNPSLQSQIQMAEIAKGAFIQSKQYPNPSIMLEGENIGGSGSFNGFESAETTLSITQPIPLGGKLRYRQKATYAEYLAMLASINRKRAELYILVGTAYINALYAEKWHIVTKKLTSLNQKIVRDVKKRKVSGASSDMDLKLAEIALGEAEIQQSRAYRNIKKTRTSLARFLGDFELEKKALTDKGLPHQSTTWSKIKELLNKSVFLNEKKLQLQAKRAKITSVKKDVWPTMSVQLGGRHFSDDSENALVLSVSTPIPLFNRNQGKIFSAEAEYTRILKDLNTLRLELNQKLYAHYLDAQQNAEESKKVAQSLLPFAKKAAHLAENGYQKGLYSYIELSNAMRTLFQEEKHYQEAHARLDKAVINILGILSNYNYK